VSDSTRSAEAIAFVIMCLAVIGVIAIFTLLFMTFVQPALCR
jgi:hypothetical protein